jgi:hypothetical protein
MIPKRFDAIEKADVEALFERGVAEGRTIEYKERLPSNDRKDQEDFLADVSAFANAAGGDLLFGVREKREQGKTTALPGAITGLKDLNPDQEKRRLEDLLQRGLEPALRVQIRDISGFPLGPVLLVRVPQSWAAPHMLTNHPRFYTRGNAGRRPLDVTEIRQAFALSESLEERIRRFRDERIARLVADELPVHFHEGAKAVVHAVPVASLVRPQRFPLDALKQVVQQLAPRRGTGYGSRPTFEGLIVYGDDSARAHYCATLFWSGAVEVIAAGLSSVHEGQRLFDGRGFEEAVLGAARALHRSQRALSLPPPVFLLITLVDVKDLCFAEANSWLRFRPNPLPRDVLVLPEVLLEDTDPPPPRLLKPALDAAWHAAGFDSSPYFDEQGDWSAQ